MEGTTQNSIKQYLTPIAIVIGAVLVAAAILFSNPGSTSPSPVVAQAPAVAKDSTDKVRPVSDIDHIKGNPDAAIKIIGFSDFECPFCKRFHDSMNEIIDAEGNDDVAWVFRHLPLDQLHAKARPVAIASECVAEQGGNDAFWEFADAYFGVTLTNDRTDIETVIPQLVSGMGLDAAAFQSCFTSGRYEERIATDMADAAATGGSGTPWSILVAANGKTFPINGAQPTQSIQQLISIARNEK